MHIEKTEHELSVREIEVLILITKGLINKEIADKLNISLTTFISHRKNITEKLGIKLSLIHIFVGADLRPYQEYTTRFSDYRLYSNHLNRNDRLFSRQFGTGLSLIHI